MKHVGDFMYHDTNVYIQYACTSVLQVVDGKMDASVNDLKSSSSDSEDCSATEQENVNKINEPDQDYDYEGLNNTIDMINSYLDVLEEKSDSLTARLKELLVNSENARKGLLKEKEVTDSNQETPDAT